MVGYRVFHRTSGDDAKGIIEHDNGFPIIWHDCVVDVTDTRVLAISRNVIPEKRTLLHTVLPNTLGDVVIDYLYPDPDLSLFQRS